MRRCVDASIRPCDACCVFVAVITVRICTSLAGVSLAPPKGRTVLRTCDVLRVCVRAYVRVRACEGGTGILLNSGDWMQGGS